MTTNRAVKRSFRAGATAAARPSAAVAAKGGLSDAKCIEKTGHPLEYWFSVLDRFGAVEKGHTAAARHLRADQGLDGWYSQGITVAYERARGVRAANQRSDGEFEVSVSKLVAGDVRTVVKTLTDPRLRKRWILGVDPALGAALTRGLDDPSSKGVIIRPDGQARFRYQWYDTVVQLYFLPKPGGKVSVVVTNSKLGSAADVEERRCAWRIALGCLATVME